MNDQEYAIISSYLAVIITLSVFNFGVPVLLLQLAIPEKLRQVAQKHKWIIFPMFPLLLSYLIMIMIILVMHISDFPFP